MSEHNIVIIIHPDNQILKYIPALRKFTGLPINKIKSTIEQKKPIIVFNHTSPSADLSAMYQLLVDLEQKGANIEIIENLQTENLINSRVVGLGYIHNLLNTYDEIDKEIEEYPD